MFRSPLFDSTGRASVVCLAAACLLTLPAAVAAGGGTISLIGQLDPSTGLDTSSEIWGWVDPSTNIEYAILGEWSGGHVHIIDVSDPTAPFIESTISNVPGFDLKVWDHYLYLVDGNGSGNDGEIWDIEDPSNPVFKNTFNSGHNIHIDSQGYLYNEFVGLRIYDLNPDPTNPTLVWSGGAEGHDALVEGNRLFDFHGTSGTFIWDITDRSAPVLLGSIGNGQGIVYHHSGVVSADGNYLYINDELSVHPQPDILVYDISTPATPVFVDAFAAPQATVHNTFRIGNYVYASYYTSGFRVFDVSDPLSISQVDRWDTSILSGEQVWSGCWGVYPYAPSGVLYVSDIESGLFLFRFEPAIVGVPTVIPATELLSQSTPNPMRTAASIRYALPHAGRVELSIYNALGRRVRSLVSGPKGAGQHAVSWNGRDDLGSRVGAGVYFYELRTDDIRETRRLTITR